MRNYEVLDSNLDILGYREFEDNSDPDILQGSAISALVILDRVLKEYNISSSSIKGILFCTRSFEMSKRFDNMEPTAIALIVDNTMNLSNRAYLQAFLAFVGFLKTEEEIVSLLNRERAFLVYVKEWLIDLVGKDRLPQSFIPNYKVDYNNLGEYGE